MLHKERKTKHELIFFNKVKRHVKRIKSLVVVTKSQFLKKQ